jgi:hypothetical protein
MMNVSIIDKSFNEIRPFLFLNQFFIAMEISVLLVHDVQNLVFEKSDFIILTFLLLLMILF